MLYVCLENGLFYLGTRWGLDTPIRVSLIRSLTTFPFAVALFYINAHFIIARYQPHRDWGRLALATTALLVGFAACRLVLYRYGLAAVGVFDDFESYEPYAILTNHFFVDTLWIGLQYLLFSYGYWFATHTIHLERQKRQLQADLFVAERAKFEAEVSFLRNQLNPHFLFNTFNFLYAESLACSPKLADSILSLTQMMRSVTELGQQPLVPLAQELTYIHHYLKIQQYRFEDGMHLQYAVENEALASSVSVPPLLFIALIENLFKYGDLSVADDCASILFSIEGNRIAFRSQNCKKDLRGRTVPGSGIGLANIQQQLNHHYPNTHRLTITDTATHFTVELAIGRVQSVAQPFD
ncbi:sensor histidine kinase [Spirosoma horti]